MSLPSKSLLGLLSWTTAVVLGSNDDLFNYGAKFLDEGGRNSFPQPEWDAVSCDDIDECTGYPEKYPFAFFSIEGESNCRWCPESDDSINCGLHRQSPIDLLRNRAVAGHPREKDCPDWHFFAFHRDTCTFNDLRDQFSIERHALQLHIPVRPNGDIDCVNGEGERAFPRLDYSKGFPDWWHMARIDISVPSQHLQEGNRYAAEVTLAHFYEQEHVKNQDYDDAVSWPYLDRLICSWRKAEEKVREACDLPPAPPYGRCRLFREQNATEAWNVEAGLAFSKETSDTSSPMQQTSDEPSMSPNAELPTTITNSTQQPTQQPSQQPTSAVPDDSALPTADISSDAPAQPQPVLPPIVPPLTPPVDEIETAAPSEATVTDVPSSAVPSAAAAKPTNEPSTKSPTTTAVTKAPSETDKGDGVDPDPNFTVPAAIDCDGSVNMDRLCAGSDPCCETVRSDSPFCWEAYDLLGPAVPSACYHCCDSPKIVGPATPPKPGLPQTVQCSTVEDAYRLCNPGSCCSNPDNKSTFCKEQKTLLGTLMTEVCYYCCSEPQEYEASSRRGLRGQNVDELPEGARVVEAMGRKFLLRKENYAVKVTDDKQHFKTIYEDYQRRSLQTVHAIDYDNLDWYAYEWMLKVGTEYYFRYEGTMLIPPCWETVHWRVMKDPIRVHKRQIDELHRLLAWRLNPETCKVDTAGILSDDGNRVAVNREIQYNTDIHRKVFCECTDWVSKYEADQLWCEGFEEKGNYDRLYDRPYGFDTGGEWIPS